ncbi:hypothetical protein DERF_007271 [Dermatophagoides farinae]|uniref:Uncharacterized protein n=1 Tax=Dermatophagoides farinae TaxID=6954 RepID=A0A922L3G7_DERFA|nr:hypothetical protein DERF_007271 [Dermatophagoides farinae]
MKDRFKPVISSLNPSSDRFDNDHHNKIDEKRNGLFRSIQSKMSMRKLNERNKKQKKIITTNQNYNK